ncbi:putative MFS family arabinose efflux permease [Terracoccus luteus]|uniref:Putative MFS family arabinose efflux permease n=1 Tax=Terracoccus luteus TaxID=53356 RepID=A0A495Y3B0_9MICO|nr:putative MFS family arabinose efflux permease [Terracoccus luteus]
MTPPPDPGTDPLVDPFGDPLGDPLGDPQTLPGPGGTPTPRRSHFVDVTPLRVSPAFARLWFGNSLAGVGTFVTTTAVGLNIYDLTGSTFAVSLVATFSLLPMIVAGLYGGAIADRFDRRSVALSSSLVAWLATVSLALIAWGDVRVLWPFYVITTVQAVAATIASATRQAITPRLLPKELLPKAAALMGISSGFMVTVGPGIAGVLVAHVGYAWTYSVDVLLFFAGLFGLWTLPRIRPTGDHLPAGGFRSVVDGLSHLRRAPNVRMSFVVDIIAMTFGQPMVLFPAVGAVVIGGGSVTAGVLLASFAVGSIVSSLGSGRVTDLRWQGRAIRNAIAVYGLAVLALGLVLAVVMLGGHSVDSSDFADVNRPALALAAVALAVAGGSDNISAIFRQSILQAAVPDHLRGRTQGVFTVVVTGGPRLGQMFAGSLATLTATWVPPVVGGVLVVVLVVWSVSRVASFRDYDSLHPQP